MNNTALIEAEDISGILRRPLVGLPFGITFFRDVDCVDCIPRAFELSLMASKLSDVGQYWIVIDALKSDLKDADYIDKFPLPIIEDSGLKLFEQFGLQSFWNKKKSQYNSDFLYAANGHLKNKHHGISVYDYIPMEEINILFAV